MAAVFSGDLMFMSWKAILWKHTEAPTHRLGWSYQLSLSFYIPFFDFFLISFEIYLVNSWGLHWGDGFYEQQKIKKTFLLGGNSFNLRSRSESHSEELTEPKMRWKIILSADTFSSHHPIALLIDKWCPVGFIKVSVQLKLLRFIRRRAETRISRDWCVMTPTCSRHVGFDLRGWPRTRCASQLLRHAG